MQNEMTIDGNKITTWYADHMEQPYTAVNMTVSIEMLKGYDLTDEEKTEQSALMAGYCRLLEERGLIGWGETEFESIQDLFSNATKVDSTEGEK